MEELDLLLRLGSSCAAGGGDERRASIQRDHQQEQQQITIFYNGRICVGNVSEIQARAIIAMAEQEMGDQMAKKKKQQVEEEKKQSDWVSSSPPPPAVETAAMEQLLINQQNSMKRSLQRFLQKRKSRSDSVAPYDARRPQLLLEIN